MLFRSDRPNLSKDYLAGTAPEEWIPLRSPEFYGERGSELKLGARVIAIDAKAQSRQIGSLARVSLHIDAPTPGYAPNCFSRNTLVAMACGAIVA